jgi:flagellar basal body-associated protein FliL
MAKMKRSWLAGLTAGLVTLAATPAFARGISLKDAGVTLWIFIIIGAMIVLLQLIPAAILFFSFIGTSSGLLLKKKKAAEEAEEKVVVPELQPETSKS